MESDVRPRLKLWLEHDGRVALSGYRARLLRLVGETGSLAEAAARMGLSYRRAWGKVREIERTLGVPLVQSDVGGAGGGGSRLTPEALELLRRYEAFEAAVTRAAEQIFDQDWCRPGVNAAAVHAGASGQAGQQRQAVADDPVHAPLDQA